MTFEQEIRRMFPKSSTQEFWTTHADVNLLCYIDGVFPIRVITISLAKDFIYIVYYNYIDDSYCHTIEVDNIYMEGSKVGKLLYANQIKRT